MAVMTSQGAVPLPVELADGEALEKAHILTMPASLFAIGLWAFGGLLLTSMSLAIASSDTVALLLAAAE